MMSHSSYYCRLRACCPVHDASDVGHAATGFATFKACSTHAAYSLISNHDMSHD